MDALNLDLVGIPTTQYDIPARYKNVTEVGNPMSPDMEIIQSLQPTDVLSVTTLEYDLKDSFDQMNLSAQFLKLDSVENMLDTIIELGNKYERMTEAAELRSSIEKKMESIKKQTEQEKTPTVLILLGVPGGSYLVATENSYVGNLVEVVGGKNAVTGQSAEYISANTEYLQQTNADVILRLSHGVPEQVAEEFQKEFSENDIWKHFNAVKNNRVFDLQEPIFATTANLNIKEAMDQLVEMLYE
ncbi:iron ABC transporter binding protein [Niallia nealsonii AAU1]|nr:iron ABC transporter binding protein [Niallia nealsonii AAU1]